MDAVTWLALGTVGRAKGITGAFMFRPYNPASDAFDTLERVRLKDKIYAIESVRDLPGGTEIKLAGIDSPEDAKRFVNAEIFGAKEELPPTEEGELWLADLQGKRAFEAGEEIGVVTGFSRAGDEIFFDVRSKHGEIISLPSSGPYIVRIEGDTVILDGVIALFG